ncbi:hypothetical protein KEM54_005597 [Ascosphaera aggregata]|nr:hypothetical protein KEM54_005597 [Ascosphaera aggregata]
MAKRRVKKRTHVRPGVGVTSNATSAPSVNKSPKSMVIRMGAGEVGSSVSQLSRDVRQMMEPDTASRLKERRANKLKDYTVMAGPLGITHLLLFSKSSNGNTNFRIALAPRGPTLTFKVENYSLCRDIANAQRRPQGMGKMHLNSPLLVMNNFLSSGEELMQLAVPKHLESLSTTIFQSLFPPISPQTTPLSSIRRVMMVNRELPSSGGNEDPDAYVLNVRHYAIHTKKRGIPKRIRRLDPSESRHRDRKDRSVPNLGKLNDVADYLLDPSAAGYTSASETEMDTDAEVEVMETTARKVLNKRELQKLKSGEKKTESTSSNVEKRAVKLTEIGPRMKLRLIKVEEGLCSGKVMWHAFVKKSAKENKEMDAMWEQKRKEKEERKRIQKENIEKKRQEKARARAASGAKGDEDDEDEDEDMENEWLSDVLDDDDEMQENGESEGDSEQDSEDEE